MLAYSGAKKPSNEPEVVLHVPSEIVQYRTIKVCRKYMRLLG